MENINQIEAAVVAEEENLELMIEELEDRTAMVSGGCATSCSCECTSTTCVVWF